MIEYRLAWYDDLSGFEQTTAYGNLCQHCGEMINVRDKMAWNRRMDQELAEFGATRFFDRNQPGSPVVARFPGADELAHFLMVWA